MNDIIKKILVEWSFRLDDGMINLNNPKHMIVLSEVLKDMKLPTKAILEVMTNMTESEASEKGLKHLGGGYYSKTGKKPATHQTKDGKLIKVGDKQTKTGPNVFSKPAETEPDNLRNNDHQVTDNALTRKTTDPTEKGVGAGTNESRAGEAATHKALRMLKEGKSYEEIEEYLMSIANQKDTYLNKSWVKASLSATKSIEQTFGLDNIDEIVWDTPNGKKLINAEKHGTSSDMFIKLKDGKRVGISLKKDGKVFIRNGGYKETMDNLYDDLKNYGVSEKEINEFKDKTSIENYTKDLNKSIVEAVDKMKDDDNVKNIIEKIKNDPEYRKSLGISDKYLSRLDDDFFERVAGRSGKRTGNDIKVLARIANSPEYKETNPEVYQNMRDTDTRHTQRLLEAIGDSSEIENAVKEDVIKGIHIDQILGMDKDMNLDSFITIYGTQPEPSQLNEESIVKMFGGEVEQLLSEYRKNPTDELRKQVKDKIKSQIQIDYKDGAKDGVIKIKHEGPPPQEYPLFTIKSRTRGIGVSPTLEMAQTTFMANALKFGLDVSKWPKAQKNAFERSMEE